jgi:Zn-dependent protease
VRSSIPLIKIMGIPIRLSFSWFLILGFIVYLLGAQVYPDWLPDAGASTIWLLALVSGLLFFVSILLHELAHSLVARAYGIPVKSITLFIYGGVAHITKEASRPFVEFVMALAGPATSIMLSGLFLLIWWMIGFANEEPITVMVEWLLVMNMGVALFNLAPGFPLDGGRVLRSVLWGVIGDFRRATFLACWCGRLIAYALMLAGVAAIVFHVAWMGPLSGLWFILLGFFLESAARQSWQQLKILEFLRTQKVGDVMSRDYRAVPKWLALQDLAQGLSGSLSRLYLLVTDNDHVVGVLGQEQLQTVPRSDWGTATVGSAMKPSAHVQVVDPETDLATALQTMEGEDIRHAPVVEDGRLVGLLSRDAILRLLLAQRLLKGK